MTYTPTKLPENASDLLNGRHAAASIAETTTAAFWLFGRDEDTALFLLQKVHEGFNDLAEELGYTVTRKDEAAE